MAFQSFRHNFRCRPSMWMWRSVAEILRPFWFRIYISLYMCVCVYIHIFSNMNMTFFNYPKYREKNRTVVNLNLGLPISQESRQHAQKYFARPVFSSSWWFHKSRTKVMPISRQCASAPPSFSWEHYFLKNIVLLLPLEMVFCTFFLAYLALV